MVSHWILSDNKSPQVSRTLLSILANLSNALVWMIPLVLLFSNTPVPLPIFWLLYEKHQLQLVSPSLSCSPIFSNFLERSRYLSFFSLSFNFTQWIPKSTILQVFFLLWIITRFSRLAEIRWFVCISESQRSLCISLCRTYFGLCIYCLFIWSNLKLLHLSGLPCPPSRVSSYILSVLICCIHLLCDGSFRLFYHITYICCFVASYKIH